MITKQEFIDIIDRLKEVNDFVVETNMKARKLKDSIESDYINAMSLSVSHENVVVKLLENMFDTDYILWWLYDLNYGRDYKEGCIQKEKNGKIINIDLSTAEKLYDFLISEMSNKMIK